MARKFDPDHGFYYSFLNADQKACYDALLVNMRQFQQDFQMNPIAVNDYLVANRAVLDDHPELWWADTPARYSYGFTGKVNRHTFLELKGNELQLTQQMFKAVEDVLKEAQKKKSEWDKALLFHDAIVQSTAFNTGADTDGLGDQNISSVLLGGNSVCAGYARTFQLLCRSSGIECVYVPGVAVKNGQQVAHAWNFAFIEGEWTWIDCTWDDLIWQKGVESLEHDYFCLNDTWISKNRAIPAYLETGNSKARLKIRFPEASSLKMEYHHVAGTYFAKYDPAAVGASAQQQAQKGSIRLRFGSTAELKKACTDLVDRSNLTASAQLRVSKDDDMCVLRIDRI
ncbi:MAG: hypothetical protein IKG46_11605 [Solobacterium sp.]|nr:hypothetical protein [Solobacterium sp.]